MQSLIVPVALILKYAITGGLGRDYQPVDQLLVIADGAGPFNQLKGGELCITVSVFDDSILEDTQTFSIHLSSDDSCVQIGPVYTSFCILDNDSKQSCHLCILSHIIFYAFP